MHYREKESQFHFRMSLIYPWHYLNLDPWEQITLIFYVMKWYVWINHFCCTLKHDDCLKKKHLGKLNFPHFSGTPFLIWSFSTSDLAFGRPFLKHEQGEPVASKITANSIVANDDNPNLQVKFWIFRQLVHLDAFCHELPCCSYF